MPAPTLDSLRADARHWLAYVGPGRLVLGAASCGALCVAGWLLVRGSPPPVETRIPLTTVAPSTSAPASGTVVVHVAGEVVRPGVYELAAGSRVVDAVSAAGGATRRADLAAVNLALVLVDTEQVYVPALGRSGSRALVSPRLRPGTNGTGGTRTPGGKVDINSATAGELDALPGIGPATAAAIVEHRSRNGPFASVDGLLDVPGIGESKLAALRDLVTV